MRFFINIAVALMQPMNKAGAGIMGFFMILWGLWILLPFWDALSAANLFRFILELLPEPAVGGIAVGIGLMFLAALKLKNYCLLWVSAGVASWYWGLFTIFCFISDWMNVSDMTYFALFLYSAFVYENVRLNTRWNKVNRK